MHRHLLAEVSNQALLDVLLSLSEGLPGQAVTGGRGQGGMEVYETHTQSVTIFIKRSYIATWKVKHKTPLRQMDTRLRILSLANSFLNGCQQ